MKKAILAALLSASSSAFAVANCVNAAQPDGAEVGLCRTDSIIVCPTSQGSNQLVGQVGAVATCDATLEPYLSQRQLDLRAAANRTSAWFTEAQAMCQQLAGQCVADRVAFKQAEYDALQAAAAKAIADAAAAAAAAQAAAAANTIMTTNPAPVQIAQPTTTPAMTTATTLPSRLPSSSSSAGYESAGSGYGGDGLSWGGRTKFVSAGTYRTAAEWDEIAKAKAKKADESVKIAQAEPAPAKRNCDEFFETRAGVEYWGSRDQKGNINNVCRKPVRK